MNIKEKRKEIRKINFPSGGMIIVSVLGISGLFLIYLSGIFGASSIEMVHDCISKNGMIIIFGLFFLFILLYCWISFFFNVIIPPRKDILYLYKNKNNELYFINKKGKKFTYYNIKVLENRYYYVLKTRDYIYEILEETYANWAPREKKSYWLNFYSPIGNFEDIFLLPIVYVILLPGVLSFILSEGFEKIFGVIFSAYPLYIIGYDFIYKIKLSKEKDNNG